MAEPNVEELKELSGSLKLTLFDWKQVEHSCHDAINEAIDTSGLVGRY